MSGNLVQNDSFEDDGINSSSLIAPVTGWTFSLPLGTMNAGETSTFDPVLTGPNPPFGSHGGYLAIGTKGTIGLASQIIPTVAGQPYIFSFQFSSDGVPGNEFQALWNGTVIMDATSSPYNNGGWSNYDGTAQFSFVETAVSSSTTIAFGGMGNGSSYVGVDGVSVTPTSTWTWIGGTGTADIATNWTLTAGTGNPSGTPQLGDTAIVTNGTILVPLDAQLNSNTVEIGGTAGITAAVAFVGDDLVTFSTPTLDGSTLITNAGVPGATTAEASLLDAAGTFINQGTIIADGPVGSTFTINVHQSTIGALTAPGYFINYDDIVAITGNSMTIAVGGTSELFNVGLLVANGGTLVVDADPAAIMGGFGPVQGIALIANGGTFEVNNAYPSGLSGAFPTDGGSAPYFIFGDTVAGDTLKIDQVKQFGGRILGFAQGNTIDIGTSLSVGTIAFSSASGILSLEDAAGTILASLGMASGVFNNGAFPVSGGVANHITLTTGTDGDTLLTTDLVNSVWQTGSGTWQTPSSWSPNVVPGISATPIIGIGALSPFTVTTGAAPVSTNSLSVVNNNATLKITSNTTVAPNFVQLVDGTIEVTGGNTLLASGIRQFQSGADLKVDANAVLDLKGHVNTNIAANNGTLGIANGNTVALFVNGTAAVDGVLNAGSTATQTGGLISIGQNGQGTPATMTVEGGGTVIDTYAHLSSDPTSNGSLTLTGAGSSWTDSDDPSDSATTRGFMLVGNDNQSDNGPLPPFEAPALLLVENHAKLTEATYARIGNSVDSAGSATITTDAIWTIGTAGTASFLNVGNAGDGTLTVSAGGTVDILGGTGTFFSNGSQLTGGLGLGIANKPTGTGTIDVTGAGSLLLNANGIGVGNPGTGFLTVENSGNVQTNSISVGNGGVGTLTVRSGGTLDSGGLAVGQASGGAGTVTVTDAGSILNVSTGGIGVGKLAPGALFVGNGGTVTTGDSGIGAANITATVAGTIVIDGIGSEISSAGGLGLGRAGQGTLSVQNGGFLDLINGAGTNIANLNLGGFPSGPTGGDGFAAVKSGGQMEINHNLVVWQGSTLSVLDGISGVDVGTSGVAQSGNVLVESGHTLYGNGLIAGAVVDSGSIIATNSGTFSASTGGTLEITGAVSGTGELVIAKSSTLRLDGALAATGTVTFNAGIETLILGTTGSSLANPLNDLNVGDRIEFANGETIDSVVMLNAHTAEISFHGSGTYDVTGVNFAGTASQFGFGLDAATGNAFIEAAPPCFVAGTRIASNRGEVPVEQLRVGDKVTVVFGEALQPIVWIGHRQVDCLHHPDPRRVWPVRVSADAFGPGLPARDLWLSLDHAVYIGGVLIPVKFLINGSSIAQVPKLEVTYYHVELPDHSILLAESLPAESYLETGGRSNFANGGGPIALHPDFCARTWEASGCAPLVVSGPELDAARQRVNSLAAGAARTASAA